MNDERDKHSSVGKTYEIDQRAIKVFSGCLPDNWLPRKQDPDFFVDYLVEIVTDGEPTGLHFAAQIKGYEDATTGQKTLSYPFKTKHLKYYLHRSQHPVFLFLINVTTREGYWLFAQKHLKEKTSAAVLDAQDSLTIHFSAEDSLFNFTKFKCLLPEAEQFVRNLHPGSVQAAMQKRKADLESKDPRCSVSISIENGKEHIVITPNESFSFKANIHSENVDGWKDFFERGAKVKTGHKELEFVGAPLMQEALKAAGGEVEIQLGTERPGSLHVISKIEVGKIIPIEGRFRSGTRFLTFHGQLPDSPLEIAFEVSLEAALKADPFNLSFSFMPKKWAGQPIQHLAYFDQIVSFAKAFSAKPDPEMEIYCQGNSVLRGSLHSDSSDLTGGMLHALEWFEKCRWLARHFDVNPPFDKLERKKMDLLEEVYDLLTHLGTRRPAPRIRFSFLGEKLSDSKIASSDKNLRIEMPQRIIDFFGIPTRLGPIRHDFTDINFVSQSPSNKGDMEVILEGTENTTRTSTLI